MSRSSTSRSMSSQYFQFITSRDISMMTQQLSTLVGAHVPMAEALAALVDQTEKPQAQGRAL